MIFPSSFQFFLRQPMLSRPAVPPHNIYSCIGNFLQQQGKMNLHLIFIVLALIILTCMHKDLAIDTMPELKKNMLNFGYGANFKYEGMFSHSFDRFYVVAKYEMPKIKDLKLTTFSFDLMYYHLNISRKSYLLRYIKHCRRIAPYVKFYKQQVEYYNQTAHNILQNEIGLKLQTFGSKNRKKRFIATILGSIASKVIELAFEGISSFLHHKRHKALHKAVNVMNTKVDMDCNRVYHLEDTMIMYGKYNSYTLKDLIETVHKIHNLTAWKEKIFIGKMNDWLKDRLTHINNEFDYSIDSILFLTTIKEKYVRMYERFIVELKSYSKVIRILSKGYLPISLMPPSKLEAILEQVKLAIAKTNKDYDLVLSKLYLYYDKKLVMFGIDDQKNLIIQFLVFVQPYTQTKLTLYQIETVPVLILDANNKAQSYTELKIDEPYIALNDETYISLHSQEFNTCKRIGYEYLCEQLFVVKSKHKYSCASSVYFKLNNKIKENCDFSYYFNKTNVTPSVLDGGQQIILRNWPNYKRINCTYNNNIPVNIPSHPHVLLDRNILCNCDIEARSNSY